MVNFLFIYLFQAVPPVIHRDIKSSNILLDQSMRARVCLLHWLILCILFPWTNLALFIIFCFYVIDTLQLWFNQVADFGLSREEMVDKHAANIRGTFGYLDPEYISTRNFTKKSDVYSFGVLLFELIAGRSPLQGLMEYVELVRSLSYVLYIYRLVLLASMHASVII